MADYNMSLSHKPEMSSMAMHMPMSQPQFPSNQTQTSTLGMEAMSLGVNASGMSAGTCLPTTMAFGSNSLAAEAGSFTNPYNMATTFNASMPMWPNYGHMLYPMDHTHVRNDSLTSLETCPPLIKSEEEHSPIQPNQMFYNTPPYSSQSDSSSPTGSDDSKAISFSTDVDTLMKAIQLKTQPSQPTQGTPPSSSPDTTNPPKPRKRYQCSITDCNKSFYQKTHLEIHTRAHTGVKPFVS